MLRIRWAALAALAPVQDLLPFEKVREIMQSNERRIIAKHQIDINSVASNNPIEDFHSQFKGSKGYIIGVYDGHGGTECSEYVSTTLPQYIEDELSQTQVGDRREFVTKSLATAFVKLDKDLMDMAIPDALPAFPWYPKPYSQVLINLRKAIAGSCALVAYIEDNHLYVACTGDCRAVLGTKLISSADAVYKPTALSIDQTLKNPKESARLLNEHPNEPNVSVRGRVLGGLMPTRAFGDARYKWPLSILQDVLFHASKRTAPKNYISPPYVTAEPEIVYYERQPEDKFLILATDGLWDQIDNETAVNTVGELVEAKSDQNAATKLIEIGLSDGNYNAERIRHYLSLKAPISRRYRDDITVNVIIFDKNGKDELPKVGKRQFVTPQIAKFVKVLNGHVSAKL